MEVALFLVNVTPPPLGCGKVASSLAPVKVDVMSSFPALMVKPEEMSRFYM